MITLPKPPSINHIYGFTSKGGFARSYITPQGKQWFKDATIVLKENNPFKEYPITSMVKIVIILLTKRRQDIDNVLKPLLDLLAGTCLECQCKYSSRKDCCCGLNKSLLENDVNVFNLEISKRMIKKTEEEKVIIDIELLE